MTPKLKLSGDITHADLDRLCRELCHSQALSAERAQTDIDLSELGRLEPNPLAILLASLADLQGRYGNDLLDDLVPPRQEGANSCLDAAALRGLLSEGRGHWHQEEAGDALVSGCELFGGPAGIDRVTSVLYEKLRSHTSWSAASLRAFESMVFELTENVVQHSKADRGVVVLEIDPRRERVRLAIADGGIGVRGSLTNNPEYQDIADDLTAIAAAMGAGATAEPGTGGGMGLYFTRLLVRDNEGALMIRSGEASRRETAVLEDATQLPELRGTLIAVETRTDLPLDYSRIEESLRAPSGLANRPS